MTTVVKAIKKRIKLNEQKLNIEHPLFTIFGGGGTFHRWNSTRGGRCERVQKQQTGIPV